MESSTRASTPFKIRCDCCRPRLKRSPWGREVEVLPAVMAAIDAGTLVILAWRNDRLQHRATLTPAGLQALGPTGPIRCDCCPPEEAFVVGEMIAGVLTIRGKRHTRLHFVMLTPARLASLFAEAGKTPYC